MLVSSFVSVAVIFTLPLLVTKRLFVFCLGVVDSLPLGWCLRCHCWFGFFRVVALWCSFLRMFCFFLISSFFGVFLLSFLTSCRHALVSSFVVVRSFIR